MDFTLPEDLQHYLAELDEFIEREIRPLEREDDNIRFFDHRREDARTDWDRGGLPSREWEALLAEARRRADAAGHYRYAFPKEYGGRDGTNLGMAVIREHLARKGLGLHCDLQNEHAIVGNNVGLLLMLHYGSRRAESRVGRRSRRRDWRHFAFGITEPAHGSDATFMETRAARDGDDWVINGEKTWNTGIHTASHDLVFARTSGTPGSGEGITGFLVPVGTPGFKVEEYLWTFNMPTDHAHVSFDRRPRPGQRHLRRRGPRPGRRPALLQREPHPPGRLQPGRRPVLHRPLGGVRQDRAPFGKPLASNQAIQFPLVELQTQGEMLRALIHKTAWSMDQFGPLSQSDKVSMCNYVANRLCCEAADRAMQVHGGLGYSRHQPFEHIYRHHRRYRITEGAEEIQMRRVAGYLFGFIEAAHPQGRHRLKTRSRGAAGLPMLATFAPRPGPGRRARARSRARAARHCRTRWRSSSRTRRAPPGAACAGRPGRCRRPRTRWPVRPPPPGPSRPSCHRGGGERLEVELAVHRDHPGHQGSVHLGDQRLEHAVRRDAQGLARLAAVGLVPGSWAYSCTVNGIPARSSAIVAVVPRPATIGHLTAWRQARRKPLAAPSGASA